MMIGKKTWLRVLLVLIGWSQFAYAEQLVYDFLPDGELRFQIQGAAKDGQYRIEISGLDRKTVYQEITNFTTAGLPDVQSVRVEHELESGIYALSLYQDTELVFESPSVLTQSTEQWSNAVDLDRRNMNVDWSVSRPCLVRVNLAMNSGILVDTVSEWHLSGEGNYSSVWNSEDQLIEHSKFYKLSPSLYAYANYLPLASDFLVVGQIALKELNESLSIEGIQLPQDTLTFDLQVDAPKSDGVHQVSHGTPIRVKLSPESQELLDGKRYEILLYLDGEFVHEESQALDPYTYILPPVPWVGENHYLSVNVLDYEGNFGLRTKKLKFK